MKICPSIASGDLLDLRSECRYIEEHFHHIHVDIEDGNYIDNITFGMKTLGELRKLCTCEMSVHRGHAGACVKSGGQPGTLFIFVSANQRRPIYDVRTGRLWAELPG